MLKLSRKRPVKTLLLSTSVVLLTLTTSFAQATPFTNGLLNTVNSAHGESLISNTTGVNLITGGSFVTTGTQDSGVRVLDNSTLTINGGSISTGGIQASGVDARNNSSVVLNSGSITTSNSQAFGVRLSDSASFTMTGGSIVTSGVQGFGINVGATASALISGGSIQTSGTQGMVIYNNGVTDILGGLFSGSGIQGFEIRNDGVTNIFGTGFNMGFGVLGAGNGTLTGTLADGSALNAFYSNTNIINLIDSAAISEPGPTGLLLMSLLLIASRRRFKNT